MKKIKTIIIVMMMGSLALVDYIRVSYKMNPIFSFFKFYNYTDDYYPWYNLYIGPLYYLKIENCSGTSSIIDIKQSTKVEMGIWFMDSRVIFEQTIKELYGDNF